MKSGNPKASTLVAIAVGAALLFGRVSTTAARARGIVSDTCQSCHSGDGSVPTLSLTAEPPAFNPGDLVTFTLAIRSATIKVGGTFITTGGLGELRALSGEGLQLNGQGLTHTAPKTAVNGVVTFRFAWQAPSKPSGVDFGVAALAGNGNNAPTGDSPGSGDFQWAFGCSPQTFFLDLDRDGYGSKSRGTLLGCPGAPPTGYASLDGDCDENDEKAHPGATEICNRKDDNCDSQIDENSAPVTMWPDQDGDGYYKAQVGTSKVGCGNVPGYAAQGGDCNDLDPAAHPGATEICNLRDDNCDGVVDERVRPRCGLGWCSRESLSCDPADCNPGPPMAETCNEFDDDCDGLIDNDACPTGSVCADQACTPGTGMSGNSGQPQAGRSGVGGSPASLPDAGAPSVISAPHEGGCAIALASPARHASHSRRGRPLCFALVCCLGVSLLRRRTRRQNTRPTRLALARPVDY